MADRKSSKKEAEGEREPPKRSAVQQRILDGLPASIEIPGPSASYQWASWAVAGLSLLLPLMHFGLIGLVAHGLLWHWRYDTVWLTAGFLWFAAYWVVYVVGGVTILFLIKPLFRWRFGKTKPQNIRRSVEPFLYDYVFALCDALGAPRPRTIQVDLAPNAFAGYRRGILSLFTGDLTLCIGLPLVQGLSVRELSGILAHEFGHFSQGVGMRLTYVSGMINQWLAEMVFERDWFDEKLQAATGRRFGWMFRIAQGFVWLTRQYLFTLFWVSHSLRCGLSREMEFDADGYEATLVGSETFRKTCLSLTDLNIAHQMAIADVQRFYDEGRLADNFPALIVSNVRHIRPEFRKEVRRREREREASQFDTHPPDRERVERSREKGPHGVLRIAGEKPDYPAVVLFSNLGPVCRAATTEYYRVVLGSRFRKEIIHPIDKMIERREQEKSAGEALDRYFLVHVPVDRPLTVTKDASKRPEDPKAVFEDLKTARETLSKHLIEYRNLGERYSVAIDTLFTSAEALSIFDCGLKIRAWQFQLKDRRPETAQDRHDRARGAVQSLAQKMLPFEEAAGDRLQAALRLLQTPKVAEKLAEGEKLAEEMRQVIPQAVFISTVVAGLPSLRVLFRRINVLYDHYIEDVGRKSLLFAILERMESLHTRLKSIRDELHGKPYPFDHADPSMTLQKFVLPTLPDEDDLSEIMAATSHAFERLFMLQVRMYAKLAQAAEKVEAALQLPPLVDPDDARKKKETDAGLSGKKTAEFAGTAGNSGRPTSAPAPSPSSPPRPIKNPAALE